MKTYSVIKTLVINNISDMRKKTKLYYMIKAGFKIVKMKFWKENYMCIHREIKIHNDILTVIGSDL